MKLFWLLKIKIYEIILKLLLKFSLNINLLNKSKIMPIFTREYDHVLSKGIGKDKYEIGYLQ